jgi:LEM3 (ligand-effect modulator 3) family / CDC50 family
MDTANLGDCDPIITVDNLENFTSVSGKPIASGQPANPCGLVAKSFFNDTF